MGFTSFIFARNSLIEEWREKSLLVLRQHASERASDIVNVILEDVVRFRGNAVQKEDITVVVTK